MQLYGFGASRDNFRRLLLCLCLLASGGCRIPQQAAVSLNSSGVPHYDQLHLTYVVDGMHRAFPPSLAEKNQAERGEIPGGTDLRKQRAWERVSLVVQYPHPSGDKSMARATLHLRAPSGNSPKRGPNGLGRRILAQELSYVQRLSRNPNHLQPGDEVRVLDVSRAQLDDMLVNLSRNGFFDAQERSDSGTAVDLHLDQNHVQKTWVAEPPLERLLARVYREGNSSGKQPALALTKAVSQR